MTELIRYDAACKALAEASAVDEVQEVRNKAEALKHYARQAKNRALEADAVAIRLRAERRLGEIIIVQRETIGLHKGGRPKTVTDPETVKPPTLTEAGIDKKLSARSQILAHMPAADFEKAVNDAREAVSRTVKTIIATAEKQARRAAKEEALGAKQLALPEKRYGVIVADPPWRFEPYSRETGLDRAADNHYLTGDPLSPDQITPIIADDCVLFLWATVPFLPQCIDTMRMWGFSYRSHVVWLKHKVGTGYWFRNKHELLLVGARGNIPAPAPGTQWDSVIAAPAAEHSAKPERFLKMIEKLYPTLPKIELYRRGEPRKGWDAWGNETSGVPRINLPLDGIETYPGVQS